MFNKFQFILISSCFYHQQHVLHLRPAFVPLTLAGRFVCLCICDIGCITPLLFLGCKPSTSANLDANSDSYLISFGILLETLTDYIALYRAKCPHAAFLLTHNTNSIKVVLAVIPLCLRVTDKKCFRHVRHPISALEFHILPISYLILLTLGSNSSFSSSKLLSENPEFFICTPLSNASAVSPCLSMQVSGNAYKTGCIKASSDLAWHVNVSIILTCVQQNIE